MQCNRPLFSPYRSACRSEVVSRFVVLFTCTIVSLFRYAYGSFVSIIYVYNYPSIDLYSVFICFVFRAQVARTCVFFASFRGRKIALFNLHGWSEHEFFSPQSYSGDVGLISYCHCFLWVYDTQMPCRVLGGGESTSVSELLWLLKSCHVRSWGSFAKSYSFPIELYVKAV